LKTHQFLHELQISIGSSCDYHLCAWNFKILIFILQLHHAWCLTTTQFWLFKIVSTILTYYNALQYGCDPQILEEK
jgi:hypothetical protein